MNEFCIEWIKGADHAGVTVPSGTALKSKLIRLSKERPDEVRIVTINEDGSIFANIPVNYVKCSPPRQVSEEQAAAASERFRQMWEQKRANDSEG